MSSLSGIHHVTAIAGDASANVIFYTNVFGLRLVKQTVNFDDPNSYHLYYGDEVGTPGTILTFFARPGVTPGKAGVGEPTAIALSIPPGSSMWWKTRLDAAGLAPDSAEERFGEHVLSFRDSDGMKLELIETTRSQAHPLRFWEHGPVPEQYAIRGVHSVTLAHAGTHRASPLESAAVEPQFGKDLGFQMLAFLESPSNAKRQRFGINGMEVSSYIDVIPSAALRPGRMGAGTIHHVAFRTATDNGQLAWQQRLHKSGYQVSQVMDRVYFHSIYFRERGGVLFEIATDGPGFTTDENEEALGSVLKLPRWYEPLRSQLEASLPSLPVHIAATGEKV